MEVRTIADSGGASAATIMLHGELDLASTPDLERAVDTLLAAGTRHIRVDLSHLRFCDSLGLNGLVRARNRCRELGGQLQVVNAAGEVAQVIDISGLLDTLTPDER